MPRGAGHIRWGLEVTHQKTIQKIPTIERTERAEITEMTEMIEMTGHEMPPRRESRAVQRHRRTRPPWSGLFSLSALLAWLLVMGSFGIRGAAAAPSPAGDPAGAAASPAGAAASPAGAPTGDPAGAPAGASAGDSGGDSDDDSSDGSGAKPTGPAKETPWAKGVSEENREKALALYKTGNGHFEESRYSQALAEYLKAIVHWDHPAIRYNMAVCYINLDRTMEAFESLTKALQYGPEPLGKHHQQAITYMRLVRGRLAELTIKCDQPEVQVTLDGQPLLTGPGKSTSTLLAGKHVVVASKEGFITDTQTLVLDPGEKRELAIELAPMSDKVKMVRRFSVWMPWTVMSIGAVVAAIGVPLILKAKSTFDRYNDLFSVECPRGCYPEDRSATLVGLHNDASAYRATSYAIFGLGGAVAAAGITLIVLNIPHAVRSDPTT